MENNALSAILTNLMKPTSTSAGKALKAFALILALAALPLFLGGTGCATGGRTEQSAGERMDDRNISSRVKTALAEDAQFKYDGVNVETFKSKVQLSGFVTSRDQKNRAGDIAKTVPGVKEVLNNITVKDSMN
jgi:hyperosmotically inducible protein